MVHFTLYHNIYAKLLYLHVNMQYSSVITIYISSSWYIIITEFDTEFRWLFTSSVLFTYCCYVQCYSFKHIRHWIFHDIKNILHVSVFCNTFKGIKVRFISVKPVHIGDSLWWCHQSNSFECLMFNRGGGEHSHMSMNTKCLSIDPFFLRRSYTQWPLFFHSVHTQWPTFFHFCIKFYIQIANFRTRRAHFEK